MCGSKTTQTMTSKRWGGWVALAALAGGLSCGGDDGSDDVDSVLAGTVSWNGRPVEGATVTGAQLVAGEVAHDCLEPVVTGADGRFEIHCGFSYEHLLLTAAGGHYQEIGGETLTLDAQTSLRGIALDVAPGETRETVVTPLTDLLVELGHARATARGEDFNPAILEARDLLAGHFGWDVSRTSIAPLDTPADSATAPARHALALAGLAEMAAEVAAEQHLSVRDVNTTHLVDALARDLRSDALFDGGTYPSSSDTMTIGPACSLPVGCTARGDGCRGECSLYWNTLRSRLALSIASFVQTSANGTGLTRDDLRSWFEAISQNDPRTQAGEPELFGGPPETFDTGLPTITWAQPASAETVHGTVTVEATANDPSGIASLTIEVVGATNTAVTDTEPTADHFVGMVATGAMPEGDLTFRATAIDEEGNVATSELTATLDNIAGSTISGLVAKGPVGGATCQVFRYPNGVKGALLGEGTTGADGAFTNLVLADGYSGPILLECGGTGGSYTEEAAPSTTVSLDVSDKLRTVIATYQDGQAVSNAAVTPLTSFAVTYYEYLRTQQSGTFAEVWGAALAAIQEHFAVPDIIGIYPQRPAEMTTFSASAKYGLLLAGLSQTAWQASNQGGGDGGTFGTSMHAVRVWKVLDQDLADGCWNGKAGPNALVFGGTQAVTADSARKDLADAIVAFLGGANGTPFTTAADILPLLETLSQSGPTTASSTCAAGQLFPTPGQSYDQILPVVVFEPPTPAADALVRQTIMVRASATDNLTAPIASWTAPAGLQDTDNVSTNNIVTGTIDTTTLSDGPLTVKASAGDASNNVGTVERTFTIDNTAPLLTWPSAGFLVDVGPPEVWWTPDRGMVLQGTVTDAHAVTVAVLIGANTYAATVAGTAWVVDLPAGAIPTTATDVTARATDAAGNITNITHKLAGDDTAPVVAPQTTTVNDERNDSVMYPSHIASHAHTTTGQTQLGGASGCPDVYKYAYFLDEGSALYVSEGAKNPIAWAFHVTDVGGVGLDASASAYRVRKASDPPGTYLTDWRTPDALGDVTGGKSYGFKLFRKASDGTALLPDLGTYEGEFDVELRGRDRFGRDTIVTRCWTHHPLAPALEITTPTTATDHVTSGDDIYALTGTSGTNRLTLDDPSSPYSPMAAEVMNTTQKGAALWGFEVWHGSHEPAYITLATTAPTGVTYTMHGQHTYAMESAQGSYNCGTVEDPSPTAECTTVGQNPLTNFTDDPAATNSSLAAIYSVRVFEDNGGVWTEKSACTSGQGCESTDARKEFELPATAGTAKHYWVFLIVRGINDKFDLDGGAPYLETTLTTASSSLTISGKVQGSTRRCNSSPVVQGSFVTCLGGTTYREYRALKDASINFPTSNFSVGVETAPTLALNPRAPIIARAAFAADWSTAEPSLPNQIP